MLPRMTAASTPPSTDDGVAVWELLLRVHAAVVPRVARDVRADTGLPLAWYDVLLELERAPQCQLRMQELGARVVLSRTRVSRIVDDLSEHGLVTRQADATDARAALATLTEQGRHARRRAAPAYLRAIEEHFSAHLDPSQRAVVSRELRRILQAVSAGADTDSGWCRA